MEKSPSNFGIYRDGLAGKIKDLRSDSKKLEARGVLEQAKKSHEYVGAQTDHLLDIYEKIRDKKHGTPFAEPLNRGDFGFYQIGDNHKLLVRPIAVMQPKNYPIDK